MLDHGLVAATVSFAGTTGVRQAEGEDPFVPPPLSPW